MRRTLFLCATLSIAVPAATQGCPIRLFGRSCGPTLDGRLDHTASLRLLTLDLAKAPPLAFGFSLVGPLPLQATLPGGCPLHVAPVLVLPFATDAMGSSRHTFRLPGTGLFVAYAQDVAWIRRGSGFDFRSSNGVVLGPWSGLTTVVESFDKTTFYDPKLGNAFWAGGRVLGGLLGRTAILGIFDARVGRDTQERDAQGREIWDFDTDSMKFPGSHTLTGKDITVTNGMFEFASFVVPANQRVRFVGRTPPRISVTGEVRIDGVVELVVPAPSRTTNGKKGLVGGFGGPGGASGGNGGDVPGSGYINGSNGKDVIVPAGHPRFLQKAGTGGRGSIAHPKSGLDKDILWIVESSFKIMVRMVAAGGGGGSLYTQGSGGKAEREVARPPFWPFKPGELGAPSVPGKTFPVLPGLSSRTSAQMFAIGGAGGGGAGAHPHFAADSRNIVWSPGGPGAGGGGVLVIRAGYDVSVARAGAILVRGGDGLLHGDHGKTPPVHAPGGGGSGGSILLQGAAKIAIDGLIDARGGKGGLFRESGPRLLYVRSLGGDGGAGYIRVEAPQTPDPKKIPNAQPPVTANNVGMFRTTEADLVTAVGSKWYVVNSAQPAFVHYVIKARVDGNTVVYSDDPKLGSRRATEGQAVVVSFQSARVDTAGKQLAPATPWSMGSIIPLGRSEKRGNGVRFLLRLDRRKTATGRGTILIDSIRFVVGC